MKTLSALGIIAGLVCQAAGSVSADVPPPEPAPPVGLANGLDGYWTFDETSWGNVYDFSSHRYNGILVDYPLFPGTWTAGQIGGALEFGGPGTHDCVLVPNFAMPSNSMTLTAWVWADTIPRWATIAANWKGAWGAFHYETFADTPKMSLCVADASDKYGVNVDSGVSQVSLTLNQWHFVAFVANSESRTITFFQDGAFAGSFQYQGRLLANSSQLTIGNNPSDASPGLGAWDGKLDDLAIWTRPLSPQELATIYNAGLAGRSLLTLMTPTVSLPDTQTVECGTPATVTVEVGEPDGAPLMVVWALNGIMVQTNMIPAGPPPLAASVSFTAVLPLGTNLIEVAVANSFTNTGYRSTTVCVVDTTPPVIISASVSPNILWPPNHKMVVTAVNAVASDNCGPATWRIVKVQSNEPSNGTGNGGATPDWQILGDHAVALRAERASTGSGRIYTITLQAEDVARNLSTLTKVTVIVPKTDMKLRLPPPRR